MLKVISSNSINITHCSEKWQRFKINHNRSSRLQYCMIKFQRYSITITKIILCHLSIFQAVNVGIPSEYLIVAPCKRLHNQKQQEELSKELPTNHVPPSNMVGHCRKTWRIWSNNSRYIDSQIHRRQYHIIK
jgi:hypothetical protein